MFDYQRYGLTPWGAAPNWRHMEWYRRGKTAFLHFTVNTFTDREWGDGTESPADFAPTALDCRQWARVLKEGGFTAAILTAKHHDGFCLWPSAYTEHSVKNSPGGVDVVRCFTDACREFGLKAGLYLSPWDRHDPRWGTEEYNDYYDAQLTELMTGYGKIWECWWDGAGSTRAHYDWKRWADTVHRYQPDCVIFGCLGAAEHVDVRWVGNEEGKAGDPCWATIDPRSVEVEDTAQLNRGKWGGSRFIPAETNLSIRPGWFYHASQDGQVRSAEELVDYWFRSAGRNTSILLNLPPDRRGLIHETDAGNVAAWDRMMGEIFAENLAVRGVVTGPEAVHPECGAENLLSEEENAVYASAVETPEILLTFPERVRFDCCRLEEVIELGHRVCGYVLEAWVDGQWRVLLDRECMGFCHSERFAPVTTDRVRLRVTRAEAAPVLRFLGLYDSRGIGLERQECIGEQEITGLRLEQAEDGLVVGLGGIYPYNTVEFAGSGAYEIHAFNGTRYEKVWEGTEGPARFATVTGSYQLKIVARGPEGELPGEIRVFLK